MDVSCVPPKGCTRRQAKFKRQKSKRANEKAAKVAAAAIQPVQQSKVIVASHVDIAHLPYIDSSATASTDLMHASFPVSQAKPRKATAQLRNRKNKKMKLKQKANKARKALPRSGCKTGAARITHVGVFGFSLPAVSSMTYVTYGLTHVC